MLQTHNAGEACNELADAQRLAIEAVARTGKAATVTLAIKYSPAAKGAFAVSFSIPKLKVPVEERTGSLWFGDEDGNLSRENPRQKELPLKTVEDPAARPAKVVNH